MTRTVTLAVITLVSALATPVVVNATTSRPRSSTVSAPVVLAAAPKAGVPACARQVRVVYAGYGEGRAIPCAVLAP
jgi:hypothetical protein